MSLLKEVVEYILLYKFMYLSIFDE